MAMMSGPAKGPVAEMNVTPMIDLLLVLIIIFMVLAVNDKHFGEEAQIPQPPPPGREAEIPRDRTVVIQVSGDAGRPRVKINRDEVPWDELQDRLMRIYVSRVEKVAFVEADKDLAFETVAEVIDVAHHAGVEKIGLMSQRTEVAQQ